MIMWQIRPPKFAEIAKQEALPTDIRKTIALPLIDRGVNVFKEDISFPSTFSFHPFLICMGRDMVLK